MTLWQRIQRWARRDQQITEHFWRSEFDCHDGTPYPQAWINDRLLPLCIALEKLRTAVGVPLIIHSGYRTTAYNRRVGGATQSQHLQGRAADIACAVAPAKVADLLEQMIASPETLMQIPQGGIGRYSTFTHYDIRGTAARWKG